MKYALETFKALLIINGAAAVSILTFLGNHPADGRSLLVTAMACFALGVLFSTLSMGGAYVTQLMYGNAHTVANASSAWRKASLAHRITYGMCGISALAFIFGVTLAGLGLLETRTEEEISMKSLAFASTVILSATPALAVVEVSTTLDLGGNAQIEHIAYGCGAEAPLEVTYINAEPNFLAIVPIDGEKRVFVNVISASGAKYVSGEYEWWSKGADATLHNVTEGLDAAPVLTCAENIETP